jgi:hypothetical protein
MAARLHGLVGLETHLTALLELAAKLVVMGETAIKLVACGSKKAGNRTLTALTHTYKDLQIQEYRTG